jgi:hypothetical protein
MKGLAMAVAVAWGDNALNLTHGLRLEWTTAGLR